MQTRISLCVYTKKMKEKETSHCLLLLRYRKLINMWHYMLSKFSKGILLWCEQTSKRQLQIFPPQHDNQCAAFAKLHLSYFCAEIVLELMYGILAFMLRWEQWRALAFLLRKVPRHVYVFCVVEKERETWVLVHILLWRRREPERSACIFY
jgi:hypothetical protein